MCRRLGLRGEQWEVWRRLLGGVSSYVDLEPPLVGAVERLIDFVTEPDGPCPTDRARRTE